MSCELRNDTARLLIFAIGKEKYSLASGKKANVDFSAEKLKTHPLVVDGCLLLDGENMKAEMEEAARAKAEALAKAKNEAAKEAEEKFLKEWDAKQAETDAKAKKDAADKAAADLAAKKKAEEEAAKKANTSK